MLIIKKTPYELWKGKKPNISYFHIFGSECFILNTNDKLSKFDPKSNPVFLGYSSVPKAYRVYNKRTQVVEETIHITFKEMKKDMDQNIHDIEEDIENLSLNNDFRNQQSLQIATRENIEDMATNFGPSYPQHISDDILEDSEGSPTKKRCIGVRDLRVVPQNQIIGEPSQGIRTKSSFRVESYIALISKIQSKCIDEDLQDQSWIEAIQEELN